VLNNIFAPMNPFARRIPGRNRMAGWALLLLLLFAAETIQAQCADVDLQAVSIDPGHPSIGKGQTTSVTVVMKNNSSCPIPAGEATAQVTLSALYLDLGDPINFYDICGQWTYLGAVSNNKQHNLFFKNNGGPIPPGGKFCSFHFDVKGKTVTPFAIPITLASSLSGDAKTADVNGTNQSTATEIHVKATAIPVAAVVPVLSDLSITSNECTAMLSWKTSSGSSMVDSFEVEYSTNGTHFDGAGTVQGKQNIPEASYSFTKDQGNGKGYYRLRIIEKGGKISLSKTVSVDTKCIIKKGFTP